LRRAALAEARSCANFKPSLTLARLPTDRGAVCREILVPKFLIAPRDRLVVLDVRPDSRSSSPPLIGGDIASARNTQAAGHGG